MIDDTDIACSECGAKWVPDEGTGYKRDHTPTCSTNPPAPLPVCPHSSLFQMPHKTPWGESVWRCSDCHADSEGYVDDRPIWPAQDHPMDWEPERIAEWFFSRGFSWKNQGAEGFTFTRNNLAGTLNEHGYGDKSVYGYVWKEVYLDLDMDAAFLLDVRRHDGIDERRQYLFAGVGCNHEITSLWHPTPQVTFFGTDGPQRLLDGLRWFADQVEEWIKTL